MKTLGITTALIVVCSAISWLLFPKLFPEKESQESYKNHIRHEPFISQQVIYHSCRGLRIKPLEVKQLKDGDLVIGYWVDENKKPRQYGLLVIRNQNDLAKMGSALAAKKLTFGQAIKIGNWKLNLTAEEEREMKNLSQHLIEQYNQGKPEVIARIQAYAESKGTPITTDLLSKVSYGQALLEEQVSRMTTEEKQRIFGDLFDDFLREYNIFTFVTKIKPLTIAVIDARIACIESKETSITTNQLYFYVLLLKQVSKMTAREKWEICGDMFRNLFDCFLKKSDINKTEPTFENFLLWKISPTFGSWWLYLLPYRNFLAYESAESVVINSRIYNYTEHEMIQRAEKLFSYLMSIS